MIFYDTVEELRGEDRVQNFFPRDFLFGSGGSVSWCVGVLVCWSVGVRVDTFQPFLFLTNMSMSGRQ